MWLAFVNKILTWEVLKKRAWHVPVRHILCRAEDEIISHLLVYCAFSKEVWAESLALTRGFRFMAEYYSRGMLETMDGRGVRP